jgi:uracil phosphoribosyltransferase
MKIINLAKSNSVLNNFVADIRDVSRQHDALRFRRNIERIGEIMGYEMSKTLHYAPRKVTTPLGCAEVETYTDRLVVATILRAGLPFHQGVLNYFDDAENAFVSAYRKYKDSLKFDVFIEYIASPKLDGKTVLIVDPMLATGSSMELTYKALLTKGTPAHLHIAAIIASKPAIDYIEQTLPKDTTVWCAAIDPSINEHSYIVPGLGDAGDLAFGVKD